YVYLGSAQGLSSTPVLAAEGDYYDLGYPDGIGTAVASGDFNGDGYSDVVGAQFGRHASGSHVYYGSSNGPSADNSFFDHRALFWGFALAGGGVNGDGYDYPFDTTNPTEAHPVTIVFFGPPIGLPPPRPDGGPRADAAYDWSSVMVGDLDQDGIDDAVAIK